MKFQWILLAGIVGITGCAENEQSDAYGQFKAVQTTISAKVSGELLSLMASEGNTVEAGQLVALIDTTQLALKKQELQAQLNATKSQIENTNAEVEVQKEQLQTARTNLTRIQRLIKDNAATRQQLDEAEGNVRTGQRRIEALETQKHSIRADIDATRARINQLEQQLDDAQVKNPVAGTVLNTYTEPHELIAEGQPLYQLAKLDTLELQVYVSGGQLPSVTLGQQVEVWIDRDEGENRRMDGQVTWIASEAEFTPRMIQTKEERVTQVYAVKVEVPNPEGILKIGMPGEVNFAAQKAKE